ncbi:MAG: hypothetical protein QCH96_07700 [Candidatus Thermoplasmatota archaeon]|nr:hypothetical protein [Candidatus Thermoplasmatota archaeon]
MRALLSHTITIHFFFLLGMFSLLGYLINDNPYLILFVALSFSGAFCGSFIKVIDEIRKERK